MALGAYTKEMKPLAVVSPVPFSEYGPPQLWEWEQPFIDDLVLNARTFNRRVVGWHFEDWDALDQENTRIWQTYYEPKLLSALYTGWQEMLAEHRQLIVEVQEITSRWSLLYP